MKHRYIFSNLFLLIIFFTFQTLYALDPVKIKVGSNKVVKKSFVEWAAEKPAYEIEFFNNINANRGTVELVLLAHALHEAGLKFEFELHEYKTHTDAMLDATYGVITTTAETVWKRNIDDSKFFYSEPVIRVGEFEKGLYTSPRNKEMLEVKSLDDLKDFSAAMPVVWALDWEILLNLDLKRLVNVSDKHELFKMVFNNKVDFTLMEFTAEKDFSQKLNGYSLVPVPNVKICLNDSRHWIISKKDPHAIILDNALQKGYKVLREKGFIEKAYIESGFFNSRVAYWNRLK